MDRILHGLTSYAHRLRYEDLPPEVVHTVKRAVADSLGCALGAYGSEPARIARRLAEAAPVPNGSTVLGSGRPTTPDLAAFVNGVLIRYLDFNDTYISAGGAGHPSDYIATVLAAAESSGADGRRIVAGIVVAYEVFCRLVDAANLGVHKWDQATHGVIASAAAAGAVAGLAEEQLANAISLAVVSNLALHEIRIGTVTMWKGCAAGNAARNGLFAALLAREGLTGPGMPFEGKAGFTTVVSGPFVLPQLGGADRPFAITECHLKRYPAGFFSQTAVDAALEARSQLAPGDDVTAAEVETFPYGATVMAGDAEKWHPATRETADHSLPYVVAAALLHGDLTDEHFDDRHLHDPALAATIAKVTVRESPECTAAWPEAAMTRITLRTKSGASHAATVRYHRGHARNPMTDDEVAAKFRRQAEGVLAPDRVDALLDAIWRLDQLPNAGELLQLTRV